MGVTHQFALHPVGMAEPGDEAHAGVQSGALHLRDQCVRVLYVCAIHCPFQSYKGMRNMSQNIHMYHEDVKQAGRRDAALMSSSRDSSFTCL